MAEDKSSIKASKVNRFCVNPIVSDDQ